MDWKQLLATAKSVGQPLDEKAEFKTAAVARWRKDITPDRLHGIDMAASLDKFILETVTPFMNVMAAANIQDRQINSCLGEIERCQQVPNQLRAVVRELRSFPAWGDISQTVYKDELDQRKYDASLREYRKRLHSGDGVMRRVTSLMAQVEYLIERLPARNGGVVRITKGTPAAPVVTVDDSAWNDK